MKHFKLKVGSSTYFILPENGSDRHISNGNRVKKNYGSVLGLIDKYDISFL